MEGQPLVSNEYDVRANIYRLFYYSSRNNILKFKMCNRVNHLTVTHVVSQDFTVCFNNGILIVKMACKATKLNKTKIVTLLIEAHNFCFIKGKCNINY